ALLRGFRRPKRRGCRPLPTSDKIGLSDVLCIPQRMDDSPPAAAQSPVSDLTSAALAAAPDAAAAGAAREERSPSPRLPALRPTPSIVAPLAGLADQARAYAKNARADNTRRAYASDWQHF